MSSIPVVDDILERADILVFVLEAEPHASKLLQMDGSQIITSSLISLLFMTWFSFMFPYTFDPMV